MGEKVAEFTKLYTKMKPLLAELAESLGAEHTAHLFSELRSHFSFPVQISFLCSIGLVFLQESISSVF